jgi:magnesium transporter
MNVAFAWRGGPLLSLHDQDLVAAQMFRSRAEHQPALAGDGMSVFLGILESKVDHLADVLESTYGTLEQLSRRVLDQIEADLQSDLVALAEVEDQNGKIRLNLMDTQRVLTSLHRSDKLKGRHRLDEVLRDVESLLSHTAFLLEEISFLSGTIIGLINIEQNQIVKVLSVVAAVFLPPTLIASLYGMNFDHMPELSWTIGYPMAIALMIILGATPYLYAKRRGWM